MDPSISLEAVITHVLSRCDSRAANGKGTLRIWQSKQTNPAVAVPYIKKAIRLAHGEKLGFAAYTTASAPTKALHNKKDVPALQSQ